MEEEKEKRKEDNGLMLGYDTVVREGAMLTTAGGILFGFLLNLLIYSLEDFSSLNQQNYASRSFALNHYSNFAIRYACYLSSHSVSISRFRKFKNRSHRFMMFGLIPAGVTLYLALEIAMSFAVGRG